MAWKFVLTDLDGIQLGVVENAYERNVSFDLDGLTTAKVRLRLDDPLAQAVTDRDGDVLIKVYQGSTRKLVGELTSAEEVGPNYRRTLSRDSLMNQGFSLGTDSTGAQYAIGSSDTASIASRGLFEAVVPFTADSPSLRQAYLREAVRVHSTPRIQVLIEATDPADRGLTCNFADPLWRLQKRLLKTAVPIGPDPNASIAWALIAAANLESHTGIQQGTLGSTISTIQDFGPAYKPVAECLTEMAEAKAFPFETPGSYLAQDDFQGGTQSGSIDGRVAPTGGTWSHAGSATSLHYLSDVDTRVFRSVTEDVGENLGIYQILSTVQSAADLYVETAHSSVAGTWFGAQGVFARYTNSTTNFKAQVRPLSPPYMQVVKNAAEVDRVSIGALTDSFYYTRLGIDASGRWAVWFWPASDPYPVAPILTGQDAALATGGSLASGKVGIYDEHQTGHGDPAIGRKYDNFASGALAQPLDWQSLDFELAPLEPTGTPPTIASFNAQAIIGTTRPNVIFDCGSGRPITTNAVFGVDYFLGDTVTARGFYANSERFNGLVRVFGADISIDDEGKETVQAKLTQD